MPAGGYDIDDVDARQSAPKPKFKGKEWVQADGGDADMHAVMLGDDDQFIVTIPAIPVSE